MRRIIILGTALVIVGVLVNRAQAHEPHTSSNQIERREKQCRYQWMDKGTWTPREEWRTARCVTEKYAVPGGLSTLLCIGQKESGWWRFSYNPNGHAGLFQHDVDAWPSRVQTWEPFYWELDPRWTNSRTQITVTARMARADGDWHQWTVDC